MAGRLRKTAELSDENRLKGLLGLCVRARQGTFGQDGCLKVIRGGGCAVLLLDESASAATREKYRGVCQNNGTPVLLLREGLLQEATGRPGVAMALAPGGLAEKLKGWPGLKKLDPDEP